MNLTRLFDTLKASRCSTRTLWRTPRYNACSLEPRPSRRSSCRVRGMLFLLTLSPNALALADTEMHLTRPFVVDSAHRGYKTPRTLRGHCVSQSLKIKREDAYLCWSNDMVLDPCFAPTVPNAQSLYCILHPWDEEAILLYLTAPLPKTAQMPLNLQDTLPWGIVLDNGVRCEHLHSEITLPYGQAAYRCESGGYLLLPLAKCKKPWTVNYLLNDKVEKHEIERVIF